MPEKSKDKNDSTNDTGSKKKGGAPLIIICLIVALLSVAGALVMVKQASAKSHVKKVVPKGPVLQLDEFLVNLADATDDHFLKVTMALEIDPATSKTPELMKDNVPLIRDAVLSALSSQQRSTLDAPGGKDHLKAQILQHVNGAMGENDFKSVYFTDFVTQ